MIDSIHRASSKIKQLLNHISAFSLYYVYLEARCSLDIHFSNLFDRRYNPSVYQKKDKFVNLYLKTKFRKTINYWRAQKETAIRPTLSQQRIWICWLQGEQNAPKIVKQCIQNARTRACGREVIVVTEENRHEYILFPNWIEDKKVTGIISNAQFSDLLRVSLLAEHGGLWLDATVLLTRSIPESIFNYPIFTAKGLNPSFPLCPVCVDIQKWTGYFLAGWPQSLFYRYMQDFMLTYWKNEDYLIDYLLLNHIAKIGREEIELLGEQYRQIPVNNELSELLIGNINNEATTEMKEKFLQGDTYMYKLSFRFNFYEKVPNGHPTLYTHLFSKFSAR